MQQTNLSLKKLKGIKPKGVKVKPSSNLDHLFELRDVIMRDFELKRSTVYTEERYDVLYEIVSDKLADVDFTEDDLSAFIVADAQEFHEFMFKADIGDDEADINGLYSGTLLHLLTERNEKLNKRTYVHIDGQGGIFNMLFNFVRKADVVIVENMHGTYCCRCAGSFNGYFTVLAANNLTGMSVFNAVASHNGFGVSVFGNNINDIQFAGGAGNYEGKLSYLVAEELKYHNNLNHIGFRGNVDFVGVKNALVVSQLGEVNKFVGYNIEHFSEKNPGSSEIFLNTPEAEELYENSFQKKQFDQIFNSNLNFADREAVLKATEHQYKIIQELKKKREI